MLFWYGTKLRNVWYKVKPYTVHTGTMFRMYNIFLVFLCAGVIYHVKIIHSD